ncbi:MAG: hypothetical protein AAGF24_16045, partial [Cyanobacteria bacterium P01_H01_bin.121]
MSVNWAKRAEQVAQEDLVMFINACLTCTGQREFYDDDYGQKVSLNFLHDYILGNYRLLYCRTLAAGINHFNQMQIVLKLLATGKRVPSQHRAEENRLITATLHNLPAHRAWKLLQQIRSRGINNRRSRAIAQQYVKTRGKRLAFHAVKYRSKLRAIATHNHLNLTALQADLGTELDAFLYRHWPKQFQTRLFEQFRRGFYSAQALYELPFTIAEGLAVKHGIPRDRFLQQIASNMTTGEKLRLQGSAEQAKTKLALDPSQLSLTKLVLYILSLDLKIRQHRQAELESLLHVSTRRALQQAPLRLGRVAAVLDRSYSSSGSSEKRRRPLGIAVAVHYLLQAAAQTYHPFWTLDIPQPLLATPYGQTNLVEPILAAIAWQPDVIIIVSDGWENDPPGGVAELLRVYRARLDPNRQISIIHCNPVFNAADFTLKRLSPLVPTVGLREAEELAVVLEFARFAEGTA